MHYRTNLSKDYDGVTGYGLYADGMKELDDDLGELLDLIKELGAGDNTRIMFSPSTKHSMSYLAIIIRLYIGVYVFTLSGPLADT